MIRRDQPALACGARGGFLRSLFVAVLIVAGGAEAQAADPVQRSGDVQAFLNGIRIPGAGSNSFIQPTNSDIAQWRQALRALIAQDYAGAARLADPVGYDLLAWKDATRGHTYYILVERTQSTGAPLRGLGTYVYNPDACRTLSFQAPHAGGDANTRQQAVAMYLGLNARFLAIAGTHRCANDDESPCDGTTTACGASGNFKTSDVAHFTQNFFEPAHEEFSTGTGVITIAIHGEGDRSPDVTLSDGTCYRTSGQSYGKLLSDAYNKLFTTSASGLTAASCNDANGPTVLCAESDAQGRFTNGAPNICACNGDATRTACSSTLACMKQPTFPERFIHLEQTCAVRGVSGCAVDGVTFQTAIDAFAAVFPCNAASMRSVVNGASFQAGSIAPGMIFSIFGDGLGSAESAGATAAYTLGGVQVTLCGSPVRLLANTGAQINAVAPNSIAGKTSCDLTVSSLGAAPSSPAHVTIAPQNVAAFLFRPVRADGSIIDTNLVLPVVTDPQYRVIGPALADSPGLVRAKRGGALTIWVTGVGQTTPAVADSDVAPSSGTTPVALPDVLIDGKAARLLYAGHTPGFIGLYQLNVLVPADAASGADTLEIRTGSGRITYQLYVE